MGQSCFLIAYSNVLYLFNNYRSHVLLLILILSFVIFFLPSTFIFTVVPEPAESVQILPDADAVYLQKLRTPLSHARIPSQAFQVEDGANLTAVYERLVEEYLAPWAPIPGSIRPPVTTRMLEAMELLLRRAHFRVRIVDGEVYYRRVVEWRPDFRILRMNCMLEDIRMAVKDYNVPNTEFYVGVGDGPHIRLDTLDTFIAGVPVFSIKTGYTYIDIPVPDPNEQGCHGDYRIDDTAMVPWNKRVPKAFFRGVTSQFDLQVDNWHTAQRIKLAQWTKARPDLFDAGLTRWSHLGNKTVFGRAKSSEISNSTGVDLVPQAPIQMQTHYKYVIDIDGGLGSSRKRSILKGNSVLVRQDSIIHLHYEPLLRPMQHFVPLDFNLRDVAQIISFLQRNDDLAKSIADAGRDFGLRHLNPASERLYWATLLRGYAPLLADPPRDTSPIGIDACTRFPRVREEIIKGEMGCDLGWKRWAGKAN